MCSRLHNRLERLHNRRNALTAADAGGRQPAFLSSTPQLEQERQQQARAAHAERVPERYRSAVDVDPVAIETQFLFDREILAGKGFVDLDEIQVVELQARACKDRTC